MTTKTMATLICTGILAYTASGEAASKSDAIVVLQEALVVADFDVDLTGKYDARTKEAVKSLQGERGDYPDAETLGALEVHPSEWASVVEATGASKKAVHKARKAALSVIIETSGESMQAMVTAETSK